PAPTVLG
ncbi:hypothetical protein Tco_0577288, partial [Tanacetum coccineum]